MTKKILSVEARLDKHEAICAERYETIRRMLEKTSAEVQQLRRAANMGAGAWKAVLGLGTVLTIIWTITKLFER